MQFTLRHVSVKETRNMVIGNDYSYVCRHTQYEEFCIIFKRLFDKPHIADLDETADDDTKSIVGFLTYNDGEIFWMRKQDTYFIVNENGKTFERLT